MVLWRGYLELHDRLEQHQILLNTLTFFSTPPLYSTLHAKNEYFLNQIYPEMFGTMAKALPTLSGNTRHARRSRRLFP